MAQDSHSSNNKDLVPSKRIRRDDDGDDKNSCDSFLPGLDYDVSLACLAQASRSDHASLFSLNRSFNALIKSGYLYDLRRQLQIAEYWVYMTCDPRVWEVFDLSRKKWMRLPKMPCDPCFNMADKESLTVSTELLVFGREFADFAIYKYSVVNREWGRCEAMNRPRCLFASGSLGTIAVIAGGSDRVGNALRSAELYDIKTGKWEILPNLNSPRKLCAGFFMDGKFYVIGGMASQTESLSCGEEYDFNTKTWRKIEGMCPTVNRPAEAPPLVAVVDNQLYAVEHTTNLVKKYNKDNNSWAVLGRLPVRADTNRGWGLGFKACGKEILVVGGQKGREGEAIVLNSWCPSSGVHDGAIDWKVVCLKEHVGVFVYNCAVMGC